MTKFRDITFLTAGCFLAAVGISNFYLPGKVVTGGAGGLATLLYYLFKIPAGVSIFGFSMIFLLFGLKILGKEFVIKSIIGTVLISVMTELTAHFGAITDSAALSAIFGALFYGIGSGLVFISGYNTGGTDILGRIVQYKLPHVSIGGLLMIINGIIILISFKTFNDVNLMLLGVLALIVSNMTIDKVVSAFNDSKLAFIISDTGNELTEMILNSFGRGVTILNGSGGFTHNDKNVLLCAISGNQLDRLKQSINEIDKAAFIVFVDTKAVSGNGFCIYK